MSHGNYSVRSGYKRYMKHSSVFSCHRVEGDYNSLWHVCAPSKTKHLLWQICRGCLPSRVRLREHHVQCLVSCPLCLDIEEDDWHVLFGYDEKRQVWNEVGLGSAINLRIQHANIVLAMFFDICINDNVARTTTMVAWNLWNN
ncbi:hypothetical protein QL285_090203 [Trifolium repens]|nr:hypothetical protein QL285_090203 [Trifolium repens]